MNVKFYRSGQTGFGLIEVMIALTLGLVVTAATMSLLVSSKSHYDIQDDLARLQENARFAVETIIKDVRMAGYYGCLGNVDNVHNQLNMSGTASTDFGFDISNSLEGIEAGAGTWLPSTSALPSNIVAGTDAIAIRYVDPSQINITKLMNTQSADLQISQNSGLAASDIVVVSDCESADMFQITNLNNAGSFDNAVHNTGGSQVPGNSNATSPHKMSKVYGTDAVINRLVSRAYYIGSTANGPALFRVAVLNDGSGSAVASEQQLVDGIEDMELTYGEDTSGDGSANAYRSANAVVNWDQVVSVRIGLLARTVDETGTTVNSTVYSVNGTNSGVANDRRRRRVFTTTVKLRNSI